MTAIRTEHLRKEYKDVVAVEDLNLSIEEGEMFSLLGVNGAGKSTTIKMLSTLTRPTGGDAWIYGSSVVRDPEKVKPLLDVSMQETAVARKLTVEENIAFYAALGGQSRAEIEESRRFIYETFGLDKIAKKQAAKLSGGWQRKLSVALALVNRPKVLFLDEPTLGLDVLARRELWHTIKALKGKMTIILTTHYMEEAEALSDRIGIMKDGRLIACATAEELKIQTGTDRFEEAFIRIVRGAER